eukprot:3859614-Pleurochrysis_carterae.AAC.3
MTGLIGRLGVLPPESIGRMDDNGCLPHRYVVWDAVINDRGLLKAVEHSGKSTTHISASMPFRADHFGHAPLLQPGRSLHAIVIIAAHDSTHAD